MNSWEPTKGQIMTKWVEEIDPNKPYAEYPRPQLKREKWESLNGLWEYIISKSFTKIPENYFGKILVPFPIESALSGVTIPLKPNQVLWYYRTFEVPYKWKSNHILINFGAVDWECEVYVNRIKVGSHRGGFCSFTFPISDKLLEGINEIHVAVKDPTNKGNQPRGKQLLKPWGICYTATSGIWQTVWLEPVNKNYITKVKITPKFDEQAVGLTVFGSGSPDVLAKYNIYDGNDLVSQGTGSLGTNITIPIPNMKAWSPEHPFLYDVKIHLKKGDTLLDSVESYFGMRKIEIKKDSKNIPKVYLNNKEIFQYGTLDQGYWPDGIYTPPNEDAMRFDVDYIKEIGFNMIRKHVKVEPAVWYHYCDKIGMLVWQDMPNGGSMLRGSLSLGFGKGKKLLVTKAYKRDKSLVIQFRDELHEMIESFYNHPCIVTWVIFNEGWGQINTVEFTNLVREWDNSRLINSVSGWVDRNVGDMRDIHFYVGPKMPDIEEHRVSVNGEFGGLGRVVPENSWKVKRYWGYKKYETQTELEAKYKEIIEKVKELQEKGMVAAIYTQITDVEQEVNGFLTYDRKVKKMDPEFLKKTNSILF